MIDYVYWFNPMFGYTTIVMRMSTVDNHTVKNCISPKILGEWGVMKTIYGEMTLLP